MPLLEGTSTDLSCKLSLTYEVNINHYNGIHHPLFTLLVGVGNTVAAFKKLFFQMSVQVFSLLGQNEREEEDFFQRAQEGGDALSDYPEDLLVALIRNNPTFPLLFIRLLTNEYSRTRSSIITLEIDFRTCQKNPVVTKGGCLI